LKVYGSLGVECHKKRVFDSFLSWGWNVKVFVHRSWKFKERISGKSDILGAFISEIENYLWLQFGSCWESGVNRSQKIVGSSWVLNIGNGKTIGKLLRNLGHKLIKASNPRRCVFIKDNVANDQQTLVINRFGENHVLKALITLLVILNGQVVILIERTVKQWSELSNISRWVCKVDTLSEIIGRQRDSFKSWLLGRVVYV
jgi:hypothetical protein